MMHDRTIYCPQGIINQDNEQEFQKQLIKFINNSTEKDIFINFEKVELVDSNGLVALANAYKQAKSQNKNFYVCNVSPSVKIIFEISQLDKVLGIREYNYDFISNKNILAA